MSRDIAIFSVFAILAGLVSAASWMSTVPLPSKSAHVSRAPDLPEDLAMVDAEIDPIAVTYLVADDADEGEVDFSLPSAPKPLTAAAKAWGESHIDQVAAGPEPSIEFEPFFAAGPFLGIMMTASDGEKPAMTQTLITEIGQESAWAVQELLSDEAADILGGYLRRAVKAGEIDRDHPSAEQATQEIEQALPSSAFTPEGLLVPIAGTQQALLVSEPEELLTPQGQEVAVTVAAEEVFAGLAKPKPPKKSNSKGIEFPDSDEVDCQELKCIALTFDDGPEGGTNRLLDILKEEEVPATFFLIGSQVPGNHEIVQRMAREGHVIGNHTWMHPQLPEQSKKEVRSQIDRTTKAIVDAGAPQPRLVRPPYGALSDMVRSEIASLGYATILWDVDTLDWKIRDTKKIVKNALADARPGGIVLMHDIHEETIDAVPEIIAELRKEGFTLVTVPELMGGEVKVGGVYRNSH